MNRRLISLFGHRSPIFSIKYGFSSQSVLSEAEKMLISKQLTELSQKLKQTFNPNDSQTFASAVPILEETITLKRKLLGDSTTDIFQEYFNIAFIKSLQMKGTESIFYYEKALETAKTKSQIFECQVNIAMIYLGSKNEINGRKNLLKSLELARELKNEISIKSKEFVSFSMKYTNVIMNLILIRRQKNEEVESLIEESKEFIENLFKNATLNDSEYESFSMYLCELYEELSQISYKKTEKFDINNINKLQEFGNQIQNDIIIARALFQLGSFKSHNGDFEGSILLLTQAKQHVEKRSNVTKNLMDFYLLIFSSLMQEYQKVKNYQAGFDLLAEFNEFHKVHKVWDEIIVLQMQLKASELLSESGRKAEALVLLKESLEKAEHLENNKEELIKEQQEIQKEKGFTSEKNFVTERILLFKVNNLKHTCAVFFELKKYDDCSLHFTKLEALTRDLITLSAENSYLLVENIAFKAILLYRSGKIEESIKHYELAIENFKKMEDKMVELDKCYAELGFIYEQSRNKQKALSCYNESLQVRLKIFNNDQNNENVQKIIAKIEEVKTK